MDDSLSRALFSLFLEGQRLILLHSKTYSDAQSAFRAAVSFIEARPYLQEKVKRFRYANGEQGIELVDGGRLLFRTGQSARSYSADLVITG